jgi:hypothetical protein
MVEEYEEDLSEWYYNHQDNNLHDWLCRSRVLRGKQKNKGIAQFLVITYPYKVLLASHSIE